MQFKSLFSDLHKKKNSGQTIEPVEAKEKPAKRRKSVPKNTAPKEPLLKVKVPEEEEIMTDKDLEEFQENVEEFDLQTENEELREIIEILGKNDGAKDEEHSILVVS